jgi:protein-tyrosine-phosphatase
LEKNRKLRVLFICIGNACRSPMAESIARHDASDVIEPCSAGLFPLGYVPELTSTTLRNHSYPVDGLHSKSVTQDLWDHTDLFINMSGETIEKAFPDTANLEVWDIADPYGSDPALYEEIFVEIRDRVNKLASRLRERNKVRT